MGHQNSSDEKVPLLKLYSGSIAKRASNKFSIQSARRIIAATKLDLASGLSEEEFRDELGLSLFWYPMIEALTSTKRITKRRKNLKATVARGLTFNKFLRAKVGRSREVEAFLVALNTMSAWAERESRRTEASLTLPNSVMHWFVSDYLREIFENSFNARATISRDVVGKPYGRFLDFVESAVTELNFKNGARPYATETLAQYASTTSEEIAKISGPNPD